jgi:hypothetical protein
MHNMGMFKNIFFFLMLNFLNILIHGHELLLNNLTYTIHIIPNYETFNINSIE